MDRTKEEIFYLKYIYFLILIFVTIICHIYYINTKDYKIVTDDALFEAAKIGSNGFASEGLQNAQNIFESIYVKILSVFCIFFGKIVVVSKHFSSITPGRLYRANQTWILNKLTKSIWQRCLTCTGNTL